MIAQITLHKMAFYAYHGCGEQERIVGNNFEVEVNIWTDISSAMTSDNVNDTINYAWVYEIVKQEMSIPSNLLEHVAGRILRAIKKQIPQVESVEVTISKLPPPIAGLIAAASVRIKS